MNETIKTLLQRRSIRAFKKDAVPASLIDQVVEAGLYAPSAMDRQDTVIVVVTDEKARRELTAMNAAVMNSSKDPYYNPPCIILVLVKSDNHNGLQDGSLVLGNMMNAAHALGLASVWINREIEMFSTAEGKAWLRSHGLDDTLEGVGAISLGYREGEEPAAKPRKPNRVVKI